MFDTSWVEAQQRFTRRVLWTAAGLVAVLVALTLLSSVWPRRVRGFLYPDGTCSATVAGTVVADRVFQYQMSQPSRSVVELTCGGGNVRLVIGLHPDTGLVVGTYPFRATRARWPAPGEVQGVAHAPSSLAGFLTFISLILSDVELRSMWGRYLRSVLALALLASLGGFTRALGPSPKVVVLAIDLNNLHKSAPDSALAGRIARLGDALRARLATACGYEVVRLDPATETTAHLTDGYFYDHPDVAVGLARGVGADWVIIPRLNRATAWVADLQAHVVRVRDTVLVSNRIVEFKGLELGPELAARLTERGAAWMADQLSQVIELAARSPTSAPARRCPP